MISDGALAQQAAPSSVVVRYDRAIKGQAEDYCRQAERRGEVRNDPYERVLCLARTAGAIAAQLQEADDTKRAQNAILRVALSSAGYPADAIGPLSPRVAISEEGIASCEQGVRDRTIRYDQRISCAVGTFEAIGDTVAAYMRTIDSYNQNMRGGLDELIKRTITGRGANIDIRAEANALCDRGLRENRIRADQKEMCWAGVAESLTRHVNAETARFRAETAELLACAKRLDALTPEALAAAMRAAGVTIINETNALRVCSAAPR